MDEPLETEWATEPPTVVTAYETLAQVAAQWRAELAQQGSEQAEAVRA